MLSLLKGSAARAFRSPEGGKSPSCYEPEDEELLSVSVDELRALIPPLPNIPWTSVAEACARTVTPIYHAVQRTLYDDVEHLAQLFVELEPPSWDEEDIIHPFQLHDRAVSTASSTSHFHSQTPQDSLVTDPQDALTILSSHPSIPTIIISPCPTRNPDSSCWVPYQDASFGNKLTVPMHPVVNDVFPPLVAKSSPPVEQWRFTDGHWWALLPTIEEQMQNGMFSRPLHYRRRRTYVDVRTKYPRVRRPISTRGAASVA